MTARCMGCTVPRPADDDDLDLLDDHHPGPLTAMRYRHAWPGLFLVLALSTLLVTLVMWGDHFLSPGPSGGIRRLLQLWAASRPADDLAGFRAAGLARVVPVPVEPIPSSAPPPAVDQPAPDNP